MSKRKKSEPKGQHNFDSYKIAVATFMVTAVFMGSVIYKQAHEINVLKTALTARPDYAYPKTSTLNRRELQRIEK